jgi:N-acyl-D-aspartate/D-glutamate deacylase
VISERAKSRSAVVERFLNLSLTTVSEFRIKFSILGLLLQGLVAFRCREQREVVVVVVVASAETSRTLRTGARSRTMPLLVVEEWDGRLLTLFVCCLHTTGSLSQRLWHATLRRRGKGSECEYCSDDRRRPELVEESCSSWHFALSTTIETEETSWSSVWRWSDNMMVMSACGSYEQGARGTRREVGVIK